MDKRLIIIGIFSSSLVLAGCNSKRSATPEAALTPVATETSSANIAGINGKWVPSNPETRKIYYNEFRDGKFVSRSPDGSSSIAAGTYKLRDDGQIQMNWYSEARKANASAVCRKLTETELECSSNQSVFVLQKA